MNVVRRNEFGRKTLRVIGDVECPWFVAKEVAEVLDISDYRHFVASLEPHQKGVYTIHTLGGDQKVSIISESAFYEFVFQSRKPEAKAFKKWVFEDLLPTLRKEGKYRLERRAEQAERLLLEADQKVLDLEARLESVREVLRDDTDHGIKIIDRVVHLNLVQQQELNKLDLHSKEFGTHMKRISLRMSNCKKRVDGRRPDFRPSNRTNVYYENDYTRFGDNIIRTYFEQCPFDTWGVPPRENVQETGELTNCETDD